MYVPAWINGSPAAFDFAITAPQRQGIVNQAAQVPLASASAYAAKKRQHLNTEQMCAASGVEFIPMVAESTGAWEPTAWKVLAQIAQTRATRTKDNKAVSLAEMLLSPAPPAMLLLNSR